MGKSLCPFCADMEKPWLLWGAGVIWQIRLTPCVLWFRITKEQQASYPIELRSWKAPGLRTREQRCKMKMCLVYSIDLQHLFLIHSINITIWMGPNPSALGQLFIHPQAELCMSAGHWHRGWHPILVSPSCLSSMRHRGVSVGPLMKLAHWLEVLWASLAGTGIRLPGMGWIEAPLHQL